MHTHTHRSLACAFGQWGANIREEGQTTMLFTKVLVRWTRHTVKMTFLTWHHEIVQGVRDTRKLRKIAVRWRNMTLSSAFRCWSASTQKSRQAKEGFGYLAKGLLHAVHEKEPFALFADTCDLQLKKLRKEMGLYESQEKKSDSDDGDAFSPIIIAKQKMRAARSAAPPARPAGEGGGDDFPIVSMDGGVHGASSEESREAHVKKTGRTSQRSAAPESAASFAATPGRLVRDESGTVLQNVRTSSSFSREAIVYSLKWNTLCFASDEPVTIDNVKLETRVHDISGKGLKRFRRAVRRFRCRKSQLAIKCTV